MQLDLFAGDALDAVKDAAARGRRRTPRTQSHPQRHPQTLPLTTTGTPVDAVGLFAPLGDEPAPRLEIILPADVPETEAAEKLAYADVDEEADEELPARIAFDPAVWMRRSDEGDFIHVRTGEIRDEDEFVSSFDENDACGDAHEIWDESQDFGDDVP